MKVKNRDFIFWVNRRGENIKLLLHPTLCRSRLMEPLRHWQQFFILLSGAQPNGWINNSMFRFTVAHQTQAWSGPSQFQHEETLWHHQVQHVASPSVISPVWPAHDCNADCILHTLTQAHEQSMRISTNWVSQHEVHEPSPSRELWGTSSCTRGASQGPTLEGNRQSQMCYTIAIK